MLIDKKPELVVALDHPQYPDNLKVVMNLGRKVEWFKVGAIPYVTHGPALVRDLLEMGRKIFVDLKFTDIPNTVEKAVAGLAGMGAGMATVTCSPPRTNGQFNQQPIIEAAVKGAEGSDLQIIVVHQLTSSKGGDTHDFIDLAYRLIELGAHAMVVPPQILIKNVALDSQPFREIAAVCPGIRLADGSANDHRAPMFPKVAVELGADFLVVGRPIYQAEHPLEVVDTILEGIEQGWQARQSWLNSQEATRSSSASQPV